MLRARVVFPEPGCPRKMLEATSPRRINSPRALPGPSSCSWPRTSSGVRGRFRAARGSAERAKRVGSDTIQQRLRDKEQDRKSTRLNSSHSQISYAVFCLKKKKINSRVRSYDNI